ncbi:TetR/AcrR family transcriptional regulator [Acinetobacter baumannii]|nr:TetR/AcrR family transcriptional regulator [Acinetobacter baumannii]
MIKIDTFDTMQIKKSFTTLKGQERIKQILRNAEIVFLTKGYSGFSIRGVATQSNISLSTFATLFSK